MSYGVILSFDLKNASSDDYGNAYEDVKKIGFKTHLVGDTNKSIQLPTTTCYGVFDGASAEAVTLVLREKVKAAFVARKFTYEIFVAAGGGGHWWGWTSNKPDKKT